MRIIGFNFKKIEAERKKDLKGKLEIKSNLQIDDIEKDKIEVAGEILKFHFDFSIRYEPNFAELSFKGVVLVIPDKLEDIKNILKDWKKKKISEETKIFVLNFVMSKCNLKALQLEEDFSLPSHIPLPRISKQQSGQANYTG